MTIKKICMPTSQNMPVAVFILFSLLLFFFFFWGGGGALPYDLVMGRLCKILKTNLKAIGILFCRRDPNNIFNPWVCRKYQIS